MIVQIDMNERKRYNWNHYKKWREKDSMDNLKHYTIFEVFSELKKQQNFIYAIKGKLYFHIDNHMRECLPEEIEHFEKYQRFFRQFDDEYYRKQRVEERKYLIKDEQLEELYQIVDDIIQDARKNKDINQIDMMHMQSQEYSDEEIINIKKQIDQLSYAKELYNRLLVKRNQYE